MSHYEDRLETEGPLTVDAPAGGVPDPADLPDLHVTDPPDVPAPEVNPPALDEPSDASAPDEREAARKRAQRNAAPPPRPVTVAEMQAREAFFRAQEQGAAQPQTAAGGSPVVKVLAVTLPLAAVALLAS